MVDYDLKTIKMKRTKIIATIGPASETKKMMESMISAGMNVARLNFSHGTHEHHAKLIDNLRSAAKKTGINLALLQDLQGPRIRLGKIAKEGIEIRAGEEVILIPENFSKSPKSDNLFIPIQYFQLYRDVKIGHQVLIDDAVIELKVKSIKNKLIHCEVVVGGIIKSHKGMNFPQSTIKCPPVTRKDIKDVEFGVANQVDYIALSFVKDAKDIINLRRRVFELEKKFLKKNISKNLDKSLIKKKIDSIHIRIIAKIERREAVDNLKDIIEVADGVMVARGDLGIEMPLEELPMIQKRIIEMCRKAGKPVIVATQMLDSMIKNPIPTRAEVSDVANAVLDGTDAIMLSGESATGKYPLKAVQYMSRISQEMEKHEILEQEEREDEYKNNNSITQVISFIAQDLAEDFAGAKLIVCATTSGFTARNISRFRPGVPIVAVTPSHLTKDQLALSWGVEAYIVPLTDSFNQLLKHIKQLLVKKKIVKKGDNVVIVAGHPFGYKGQSNLIKVEVI